MMVGWEVGKPEMSASGRLGVGVVMAKVEVSGTGALMIEGDWLGIWLGLLGGRGAVMGERVGSEGFRFASWGPSTAVDERSVKVDWGSGLHRRQ
jgi:hypothetical protein